MLPAKDGGQVEGPGGCWWVADAGKNALSEGSGYRSGGARRNTGRRAWAVRGMRHDAWGVVLKACKGAVRVLHRG